MNLNCLFTPLTTAQTYIYIYIYIYLKEITNLETEITLTFHSPCASARSYLCKTKKEFKKMIVEILNLFFNCSSLQPSDENDKLFSI